VAEEIYNMISGYTNYTSYKDDVIIKIHNKRMLNLCSQVTNAGEKNAQYIVFEMDRYIDGIDQTTKTIKVHYERPDEKGDNNSVVNVKASSEHIRFGWIVPAAATAVGGILKVMPYSYSTSGSSMNYLMKICYGIINLEGGLSLSSGIAEPTTDWYEQFTAQMEAYVAEAKVETSYNYNYAHAIVDNVDLDITVDTSVSPTQVTFKLTNLQLDGLSWNDYIISRNGYTKFDAAGISITITGPASDATQTNALYYIVMRDRQLVAVQYGPGALPGTYSNPPSVEPSDIIIAQGWFSGTKWTTWWSINDIERGDYSYNYALGCTSSFRLDIREMISDDDPHVEVEVSSYGNRNWPTGLIITPAQSVFVSEMTVKKVTCKYANEWVFVVIRDKKLTCVAKFGSDRNLRYTENKFRKNDIIIAEFWTGSNYRIGDIMWRVKPDIEEQPFSIFSKVCVCGDSYTDGWTGWPDGNGYGGWNSKYARFLQHLSGVTIVPISKGGTSMVDWLSYKETELVNAGKMQAYYIMLGINDAWGNVSIGSESDIGTDNATSYGGLSKIIDKCLEISPSAYIFLQTIADLGMNDSNFYKYSDVIRNVATYYKNNGKNVHLIDANYYGYEIRTREQYFLQYGNHPYPQGYQLYAQFIFNHLNEYMKANPSDFYKVPSIPYDI